MSPSMLAAYVSGHGFGHTVRTGVVLRAFRALRPEVPIALVGAAPEDVARRAAGEPLVHRRLRLDVGLVQHDALQIDEAGTAAAVDEFRRGYRALVDAEARWMREAGVRLVLGDVPPAAFDAAARAGVPAIGLTNFSWDWIYAHLARRQPSLAEAAAEASRAYGQARLLLELPFAGDLGAFPVREPIPLVARRPFVPRADVRRRLGVEPDATVVLLSFGGIGLPGFRLALLAPLEGLVVFTTEGEGEVPPNVRRLDVRALEKDGLDYVDVVGASDVVVTKPGYGIVSDAAAAGTRMIYTERGDFPEYPILVRAMTRYLAAVHVSNEDLVAGRLREPIDRVLALPLPSPPPMNGADVAAARLAGWC
jgi:L-arabinokinase